MNIGMFVETLSLSNGVSRVVLALTERFVRHGHEVHIYSSKNRLPEAGRALFPDPRIGFHWLPSLRGSFRTWSLPLGALLPLLCVPLGARNLQRQARRHDVVVSHALTLRQDVIDVHNDPQSVELAKLSQVPYSIDPPRLGGTRRALRAAIERFRFRPASYRSAIVHSARSAAEIKAAFEVPADRIAVIPHGVNSAYFCPSLTAGLRVGLRERLGLGLNEVVYLYVGDSWKGLEFAIRGIGLLPRGAPAALLAAGPFPRKPFADLARECGVRFLCEELWEDVRSIYSVADVLVNPTPLDTFSLAGLEAMAMRLPLIITRQAGLSELLVDGENALLLDGPSDPLSIAQACAKLLEPDVRVRMAEKARQFAVSRTWDEAASAHLRAYAALAEQPAAGAPVRAA